MYLNPLLPCLYSHNSVEGKIRSNTSAETKKGQGNLFVSMRERLQPAPSIITPTETPATSEQQKAAAAERASVAYAESAVEDQTQQSCWANICTALGMAPPKHSGAIAAPPPKDLEDIIVSICMCHYKLGKVHEKVMAGCCTDDDASLIRSEITKINTSLSKIADE
jgi:hypothetical protein